MQENRTPHKHPSAMLFCRLFPRCLPARRVEATYSDISFFPSMLHVLIENEGLGLVDEFLHGVIDKLIERIDLLRHKGLVREVTCDHCPAIIIIVIQIIKRRSLLALVDAVLWERRKTRGFGREGSSRTNHLE